MLRMIKYLQQKYALSEIGAKDLCKGIVYSVLANISLMLPVALFALVINILLSSILNQYSISNSAVKLTILGIVFLIIIFILHYLQYTKTYIGTYKESASRRITIAEHLRKLPISFFGERDIADLTGVIMGDCAGFEHAFSHTVPQFYGSIISTVIICIVLLCVNWKLGFALLWVAPIAFLIVICSKKLQGRLGLKHIEAKNNLSDGIQEFLENIQEIKSCNNEEYYLKKLDDKMDITEKSQISSEMTSASLVTTGQMFLRLGLATVIVVGSKLVLSEDVDLFTYILFLIAASRIYDPLSISMNNMAELFGVDLQVNRMKEIMNYRLQEGDKKFNGNNYTITFEHVNFSYEKGKDVLKDVSFKAEEGKVTALVGPSGGGKSTIAKLAARFHDINRGRILLGGIDISLLDPTDLLKNFSFVFQDVVLFNNTIMENIRTGRKNATDAEVIKAAKAAQCDQFIMKMKDGYQTVIGENGSTLSGGECQRISIARALLKNAPVILLDEATASLDVDSETQVQKAISRLVKGKTVIVIAHRMRTIEEADKIVVLKDGVVEESGTNEELMKNNGFYRHIVDLQMKTSSWSLKKSKLK